MEPDQSEAIPKGAARICASMMMASDPNGGSVQQRSNTANHKILVGLRPEQVGVETSLLWAWSLGDVFHQVLQLSDGYVALFSIDWLRSCGLAAESAVTLNTFTTWIVYRLTIVQRARRAEGQHACNHDLHTSPSYRRALRSNCISANDILTAVAQAPLSNVRPLGATLGAS
jgi:hypothetical protein